MIKVLILNDVLTKGGKERRIVELLKYCKQHYDISFEIIFMHDGVDFPEIYDTGYKIHILEWSNWKSVQGFRRIFSITRSFQPDIIHSWSSMTDMVAVGLKLFTGKKFISSMIAEALPFRSYRNKDYSRSKISFHFADIITSNTNAGLISYKAPISKSICIYNGFNYDRIKHLENPVFLKEKYGLQNKFIVGMVAAFAVRKDYETLITAARSLLKKYEGKLAFMLIGTGALQDSMVLKAGNYAHKEIIFTGLINNVENYINIFDLGVLCTNSTVHGEGISNFIMECMALAKPVIATEGGGTAEIIVDQHTGYLIPAHSPQQLEEKIIHVMNNPLEGRKMGSVGSDRIKEQFTIESMCNSFYNLYEKLTNTLNRSAISADKMVRNEIA